MNKVAFEQAKKALQLVDVYLVSVVAGVAEDFDPRAQQPDYDAQHRAHLNRFMVLRPNPPSSDQATFFRVEMTLGYRWGQFVPNSDASSEASAESLEEKFNEAGQIESVFIAEYEVDGDVHQDGFEAYASMNSGVHIWPYWRELVSSTTQRLNLPKMTLPVLVGPLPLDAKLELVESVPVILKRTGKRGRTAVGKLPPVKKRAPKKAKKP